jgi:hypothetical protein
MNNQTQDWLKQNLIQIVVMGIGLILAWGAMNARIAAIEAKVIEYPSQDWFELKFQIIEKNISNLEVSLRDHQAEMTKLEKGVQ